MDFPVPSNFPKLLRPKADDEFKPRVDQSRQVLRYRAGRVPEYVQQQPQTEVASSGSEDERHQKKRRRTLKTERLKDSSDESSDRRGSDAEASDRRQVRRRGSTSRINSANRTRLRLEDQAPQSVSVEDHAKAGLRRRRRLAGEDEEQPVAEVIIEDDNAAGFRRRRGGVAEEVKGDTAAAEMEVESDEEAAGSDAEEAAYRRRRDELRQRRKQMEAAAEIEGEENQPFGDEAEPEFGSGTEDSDSDSDAEARRKVLLVKPVFKPKEERVALEMERLKEEEARVQEEVETLAKRQAKREESKQLLETAVKQAEAEDAKLKHRKQAGIEEEFGSDDEFPDDEISDEDQAYEDWKLRELGRLRRDFVVGEEKAKQAEGVERRRQMTEEERRKDDQRLDAAKPKVTAQGKMNYMQKYYHKGAFFQDIAQSGLDKAFQKDFNAPVAEDLVDKSLLPAIMRVRRGDWGKRSRSKHTNLKEADTTDRTAAWCQKHNSVFTRRREAMGGLKGAYDLDRPAARKQR